MDSCPCKTLPRKIYNRGCLKYCLHTRLLSKLTLMKNPQTSTLFVPALALLNPQLIRVPLRMVSIANLRERVIIMTQASRESLLMHSCHVISPCHRKIRAVTLPASYIIRWYQSPLDLVTKRDLRRRPNYLTNGTPLNAKMDIIVTLMNGSRKIRQTRHGNIGITFAQQRGVLATKHLFNVVAKDIKQLSLRKIPVTGKISFAWPFVVRIRPAVHLIMDPWSRLIPWDLTTVYIVTKKSINVRSKTPHQVQKFSSLLVYVAHTNLWQSAKLTLNMKITSSSSMIRNIVFGSIPLTQTLFRLTIINGSQANPLGQAPTIPVNLAYMTWTYGLIIVLRLAPPIQSFRLKIGITHIVVHGISKSKYPIPPSTGIGKVEKEKKHSHLLTLIT